MMKNLHICIKVALGSVLFCLMLGSCRNQQSGYDNHTHTEIVTQDIPQEFLKFYMNFLSDTTFQKAHILFPLKQKADGTKWLANEWVCHKPYNDNGEFQQQFSNMNGLILETITDPKGLYQLERRYMPSGESYSMIYFAVMNAFENSEDWDKEVQ